MRKAKKVDVITRLESLSKDESMPLAVREDAGRELIRLTMKDKPPAPAPPAPTYTEAEMIEAFQQIATGPPTVSTAATAPPVNKESESQAFAHDAEVAKKIQPQIKPEPSPRDVGSHWMIGNEDHVYISFDSEKGLHILTPARNRESLLPTTISVTEDKLMGRDRKPLPQERRYISDGFIGTLDEIRERNRQKQERAREELRARGGQEVGSGDPTLGW